MRSHGKHTDRFPDETDIQGVIGEYQDLKETAIISVAIQQILDI